MFAVLKRIRMNLISNHQAVDTGTGMRRYGMDGPRRWCANQPRLWIGLTRAPIAYIGALEADARRGADARTAHQRREREGVSTYLRCTHVVR